MTNLLILLFFIIMLIYLLSGYKIIRPLRNRQMELLAQKYNFKYQKKEKRKNSNILNQEIFEPRKKRKNIISGVFNKKTLEIYDFDRKWYPLPNKYGSIPIHVTIINGKIYKDKILPYLSIKKIEKLLNNEITLNEYGNIRVNKGVFFLISLTSVITTIIIGKILYISYYTIPFHIVFLFFIINLIVFFLAYKISKKAGYKMRITY